MQVQEVIDKLQDLLQIKIKGSHLRFYDRIALITPDRSDSNRREFDEVDLANLVKAVCLSDLNFPIGTIRRVVIDKDKEVIERVLKRIKIKIKIANLMKETL